MYLNLKKAILEKFRTQVDFCHEAKISETKLSYIIRGRRRPSTEEQHKIAHTLGVAVEEVFQE